MSKQYAEENLLEWYGNLEPASVQVGQAPEEEPEEKPQEKPQESPEKVVDKIEKGAELHKAMAMIKALDNKLALMSGAFSGYDESDKKDKLKNEAKELIKRIQEIINEL